jgi:hypothetical protein
LRSLAIRCCVFVGLVLGAPTAHADTRPPVDIPGLRAAQAQDAAIVAIDGQIRRGEWRAARDGAAALLEESKRVFHGALQRALVRLALLEAKLSDDEEALEHWQALQAMAGTSLAEPLYPFFGAAAEKLKTQPTRAWDEVPAGVESLSGLPGLVPPRRAGGDVAHSDAGCAGARGPLWARFQAVIDAQGRMRQPTISGPSVCFDFEVLSTMRGWRFEAARRNGVAVAAMYAETIHPPAKRTWKDVATSGPGVADAVHLLEDGKLAAAEAQIERQWNAALDGGSPSRPPTVTWMALRALALAAHDDAESERRASCLWEAAQGEEPAFYDLDLAAFGKAGERLAPHRYGEVRSATHPDPAAGERMERPQLIRETRRVPRARLPAASYGADRVFIEGTVDAEGSIREPILIDRSAAMHGLDLEALDAVCGWRFHPATVDGKPVAVLYVLGLDVGAGGARPSS